MDRSNREPPSVRFEVSECGIAVAELCRRRYSGEKAIEAKQALIQRHYNWQLNVRKKRNLMKKNSELANWGILCAASEGVWDRGKVGCLQQREADNEG